MFHLFTYCTNKEKVELLEKTTKLKNISLTILYEPQSEYKGYVSKIMKIKEVISTIPEKDIICFVDAYDVLCFVDNEKEIIDKFLAYNCDLLIGAEFNSYPYGYDDKYIPIENNNTNLKYVNSGGYIGYQHALNQLYHWKSDNEIIEICKNGGDQTYFIEYYLAHYSQKCQLDYKQMIFQNMFLVSWYDFVVKKERVYNYVLDQYPCFMHFNGLSYQTDINENIMYVFVNKIENSISNPNEIYDFFNYKKSTWPNPTILSQLIDNI
jgi:hypothetical protein